MEGRRRNKIICGQAAGSAGYLRGRRDGDHAPT
jgi:hypothetical protein